MDTPLKGSRVYTVRSCYGMHSVEFREVYGSFIPKVKRGSAQLNFENGATFDIVESNDHFEFVRL